MQVSFSDNTKIMILALFGTNPYPFDRLTELLEIVAAESGVEIVAQIGASRAPTHCTSFDFAPRERVLDLMRQSELVIAQGGYGSCLDALSQGRPLVIVPRRRQLGESLDDQLELADLLSNSGRAQCAHNVDELREAIADTTNPLAHATKQPQTYGSQVAVEIARHLGISSELRDAN